jgi:hypothetical protein
MFNEKEVDLTDIEASRYMFTKKVNDDHLKLCVESKDILDFVVKNSTIFNHEAVEIFMVQICSKFFFNDTMAKTIIKYTNMASFLANHCEIKRIYLVDEGLYCVDKVYDLTVPSSPIAFANISPQWFQALYAIKVLALFLAFLLHYVN